MSNPNDRADIALFVGGVRSGKSDQAQAWLERGAERKLYVATCSPRDPETLERVERHRKRRGDSWDCIEAPLLDVSDLRRYFSVKSSKGWGAQIDCLSMYLANALEAGMEREEIFARLEELFSTLEKLRLNAALVSAECGLGFVPLSPLARKYGDLLGELNQFCAARCQSVYFVSCGLLLPLKEANSPASAAESRETAA
ncbi:MAG: bifunctional adenosylcobinamide kinase/adenosylcobinamide-phosphate guanylyltransferase [Desulfovibrio sp.]|nr:bifunctional adenosylcobinamide kinase/adenosylcobinamide-phosphate guanylyltransferase [Desulfovibrio sp.]